MRVTIVAANTFEYDARQLRTARALAGDGHAVTLVGFADVGLAPAETLDGGIELRRIPLDLTVEGAFRPLPPAARRALAGLLGIPAGARSLPPGRPTGLDRLRAPLRRLVEIVAHVRRTGPWTRAVLVAAPPTDVFACKALIALPVIRGAARRRKARFVYDIADIHTEAARLARMPAPFRALVRARERGWMRDAAGLTAVSGGVADEVVRRFGVLRPTVVMNCPPAWRADEPVLRVEDRLRPAAGLPPERRVILYQGGFSVDRGIEELVAALDDPALADLDVAVVCIGYGRLEAWLRAEAARRPGRLAVLAAIAPAELLAFTATADVGFVGQPPRTLNQRLNLANKLFEYMAVGIPAVVARDTAHCELVRREDVGACVEIDDVPGIARACADLLVAADEPAAAEARRARIRGIALARYTWEVQQRDLVALYRRLAGDGAAG